MSLWQIAVRDVWRTRGRYLSYLGSAAFAVAVYFIYTALALHPDLLRGEYAAAAGVVRGIKAASILIAGITFLFLLTSNSAFIRSRKKEFGLLALMGVSQRQMVKLILVESLLIGVAATAVGLGFALLFLRLFFMAISVLLRLPETLPFYAGLPVWRQTLGVFGAFYLIASLASLRGVVGSTVIELIRAERKPMATPTFTWWKVLLGLLLVIGGYVWACSPSPTAIILGVVWVTIMVSAGTYLLMREFSIAVLAWLRRRESFYLRPGPFLSINQLAFKLQENYRVLANTAIAIAVILTAVGTIYSMLVVFSDDARTRYPIAFQIAVAAGEPGTAAEEVDSLLQRRGVKVEARRELTTVAARLDDMDADLVLAPYSLYASVDRIGDDTLPAPAEGSAILTYPYTIFDPDQADLTPRARSLVVGDQAYPLTVQPDFGGLPLNEIGTARHVLVLPDEFFEGIVASVPAGERMRITMWEVPQWRGQAALRAAEEGALLGPHFSATAGEYMATVTSLGIALFVGVFVSLVFFAASCSILYFRLFTEVEEDRRHFRRLENVGVSRRELGRVSLGQAMVLFFVPFLVGLVHSTFAMKALGTLLQRSVLHYGWLVAVAYLGLYGLYFAVTYAAYWRTLSGGARTARV